MCRIFKYQKTDITTIPNLYNLIQLNAKETNITTIPF